MPRRRGLSWFVGLTLVATLLATTACAGEDSGLKKLEVYYSAAQPNLSDIQLYVAQDKGLFEKHGLDVEIKTTDGDAPTFQALVAGRADVAFVDSGQLYTGVAEGAPLQIILDPTPTNLYYLLADPKIKTWQDLAHARIGISAPGTLSERIVEMAMAKENVPTKDVTWLAVGGSSGRLKALQSNRIDAGIGFSAHVIASQKAGDKVFSNLAEELPQLQGYMWGAQQRTVEDKREELVAFDAAMIEATRMVVDDKDVAISTYVKHNSGTNEADATKEYSMLKGAWHPDGGMTKGPFAYTTRALVESGAVKKAPSFDQVMATDIRDEALK
ncbi:MAG: PhnD/SsuA/transferrin family substrate-binding protein [Streptosporangiales bacterium]|nr:PhnD/SsuA/transferrin family substrate-binding protein [Streptosporangiales bacterium]